jgi:hypothetical protein
LKPAIEIKPQSKYDKFKSFFSNINKPKTPNKISEIILSASKEK